MYLYLSEILAGFSAFQYNIFSFISAQVILNSSFYSIDHSVYLLRKNNKDILKLKFSELEINLKSGNLVTEFL